MKETLPEILERYKNDAFWDTPLSSIDLQLHRDFVIERLLQYGGMGAIRWLLENWGGCCDRERRRQQPQSLQDDSRFLGRLPGHSTGENPLPFRTDVVPPEVVQLLSRSSRILEPLPEAYLAGGTALSLHLAHRLSVDLYFFVSQSFLAQDIRPRLIEAGRFAPITVRDDSIVCRIDTVQWSLFRYEYPLLEIPERYADIRIASVRDIAAMKVAAIGDRGSRKDFYDLYTIMRLGSFDIRKILEDVVSKFQLPQDNLYHYIRALTYFDDAIKAPDIQDTLRIDVRWPDVELFFSKTLIF